MSTIDWAKKRKEDAENAANVLSNYINNMSKDEESYINAIMKDHRFLQNEIFHLNLKLMIAWAKKYEEGQYDETNEFACKTSYKICKFLGYLP